MPIAPSVELKVKSLTDCWAFFDLIGYHGGTANFDSCHYDFLLVLQAPQLLADGLLTGDTYTRWYKLTEEKREAPTNNRFLKYPRGCLKSTLIIGWLLYRIYRNPSITILQATNVRDLSEAFIRELRSYLEDDELQETVWNTRPHIQGPLIPALDSGRRLYSNEAKDKRIIWNNYQLQVNRPIKRKEPTIFSTSAGGKVTGHHYDLIVMDDVVDFDNASSQVKIARIKRWFADSSSVVTRIPSQHTCGVVPSGERVVETLSGEYVVTGTHYAPDDLYSFIDNNLDVMQYSRLSRNIYANGHDNSDGYLWGKFTQDMESRLRAELSEQPGVFEAQYLNLVKNPALQILSTSLVQYVSYTKLISGVSSSGVNFAHPTSGAQLQLAPILAIDPASSLRASADFTAIAVGGYVQNDLMCADMSVGHYTPEFIVKETIRLVRLWQIRRVYVETVGFQKLLYHMVVKAFKAEGIQCSVLEYLPQGNKLKRIEYRLSPLFNEGRVLFSDHLKSAYQVLNTFDYFGRGGRDDPPDALAVIAEKSRPTTANQVSKSIYATSQRPQFNQAYGGIY
jgi:predicted phage terminase large subunit-like protein